MSTYKLTKIALKCNSEHLVYIIYQLLLLHYIDDSGAAAAAVADVVVVGLLMFTCM